MLINSLFWKSKRFICLCIGILNFTWLIVHAETELPPTQIQPTHSTPEFTPLIFNKPFNGLNNPYHLLVSLAFGTKNALGIQSYAQAYDYFCSQARDTQDANAQFAMGWMYSMGKGVGHNDDTAALFFNMAASQGHVNARAWLENNSGDITKASLPSCMEKPVAVVIEIPQQNPVEDFQDSSDLFYRHGPIYQIVKKHATSYDIDVDFAMAVIAVESGFNTKATSPKNAQGLMQLMPETQVRFNVKDPYNPEQNIKGGLSYLRWLLTYFKGDVELVAAAYNAGEHNVVKYQGIPPFPETQEYIKRISKYYKRKFHAYKQDLDVPHAPIKRKGLN